MADKLNGVFISEILADNAGGSAIDTDGDGRTNKSDEFIELQNASGSTVSLDGFEVWSEKNGLLFSFGASDTIDPGDTATIVGNYGGTPPAGYYDAGISEGANWIPDGENQHYDSIFLVDSNTGEYVVLSYGDPPRTPTLPSGFPGTTQIGAGETIGSNAPNGTAFTRDANGDLIEAPPTPGTPDIPCFLKGTRILTEHGLRPVEALEPGMSILTKDAGFVRLRAIGCFAPTPRDMMRNRDLDPVMFAAGSIGNMRDLYVSASHRVMVRSPQAALLLGQSEVLVSARQCIGHADAKICTLTQSPVYYHLLFDRHEIICAEGSWLESLFLADHGLRVLGQTERWTIDNGIDFSALHHDQTARMVLKQFETRAVLTSYQAAPAMALGLAA